MDNSGRNSRRISDGVASDMSPSWSPDGKQIVFISQRDAGERGQHIFKMNADGSNIDLLLAGTYTHVSWSPNGQTILFERLGHLYLMNMEKLTTRTLLHSGITGISEVKGLDLSADVGTIFLGAWAPDSREIAFGSGGSLYIIDLTASRVREVNTYGKLVDGLLAWSPDGKRLAFGSADGIYIVELNGKKPTRLPDTLPGDYVSSWGR